MSRLAASIGGITILLLFSIASSATASIPPADYEIKTTIIHVAPAIENIDDDTEMPCEAASPYMKEILVRDMNGNVIAETVVGSQVVIEATVSNNCKSRDGQELWALVEVRGSAGITNYLSWQIGTPDLNKQITIGSSWVAPNVPGKYEVRGFGIGCLQCPMVLHNVLTYELTVVPRS